MTEKLYYDNSYIAEFTAVITEIVTVNKKTALILDKTAFFPEGGGQSADTGYIGDAFIIDVYEKDGVIYHLTDASDIPPCGIEVLCRIDWVKRFSRMQAHTGEHIVSGVAHSLFGVDNTGFHMDDTVMTVDFNLPLTREQLCEIEKKANESIYKNLSVKAYILPSDKASEYNYRSKLEFTDDVRLVEIENTDLCACCAPHVRSTGEIGIIKILTAVSHRGGVRITLICGKTAFEDYTSKHNATLDIAALLCSRHNETATAVSRMIETNNKLKYDYTARQKVLLEIIASGIASGSIISEFYDNLSMDDIREICNIAKNKCEILCIILSGNDENGYSYCIYSDRAELQETVKLFNASCNGSGGGRGNMLQGRVKADRKTITDFFNELKV